MRRALAGIVAMALVAGLAVSCSSAHGGGGGGDGGSEVSPLEEAGGQDGTFVCGDLSQPCCEGFCNGNLACNVAVCAEPGPVDGGGD
jgi:hypothetical protein